MFTFDSPLGRACWAILLLALVTASCGNDTDGTYVDAPDLADTDRTTSTADHTDDDHAHSNAAIDGHTPDFLGDYTLIDDEFGTEVTVTVDGETRTIVANSLPNHETGEFPNSGNPNTISEQALTLELTTDPVHTGIATDVRQPGIALNGVTFEPETAETATCASGETYRIEALQDLLDLGLDFNNAHVQPGGKYHYHGLSDLLTAAFDNGDDLVLVGFAADGHLMYVSLTDAYATSYELSNEARSGTACLHSGRAGITLDLDGTVPDGTYGSDWIYSEGTGDLDECNGTVIDGQYVYVITDAFPYIPRCMMGEVTARQQ